MKNIYYHFISQIKNKNKLYIKTINQKWVVKPKIKIQKTAYTTFLMTLSI